MVLLSERDLPHPRGHRVHGGLVLGDSLMEVEYTVEYSFGEEELDGLDEA